MQIMLGEPINNGELFISTTVDLMRSRLVEMIKQRGAKPIFNSPPESARIVSIKNSKGASILKLSIAPLSDSGGIIKRLLIRNVVILALPWCLLICMLLIWCGWKTDVSGKE